MVYETKRLYTRKMTIGDIPSLKKILQDEIVMYAYEHAFSDDEVLEWVNRQFERYQKFGYGLWVVILKDTNEMIGQCGLSMQDYDGRQVLEIGYLFSERVLG